MKRLSVAFLFLLGLPGCGPNSENTVPFADSPIIEATILWSAQLDPVTWEPLELKKLLRNRKRFGQEGNFYKVKDGTKAFGHEVLYIGMLGIDLIPGPNVTLKGTPDEIAQYITQHNGIKLLKVGDEFRADLKKDIVLLVGPHPSRKDASIVIGAYLGK